jgi:hypothetical protein
MAYFFAGRKATGHPLFTRSIQDLIFLIVKKTFFIAFSSSKKAFLSVNNRAVAIPLRHQLRTLEILIEHL